MNTIKKLFISNYQGLELAVTNKQLNMKKIKDLFYRTDLNGEDRLFAKKRLKYLWYISNPEINNAIYKYLWHKYRRVNQYKLLSIEDKMLEYFWSVEDPSKLTNFVVEEYASQLMKKYNKKNK